MRKLFALIFLVGFASLAQFASAQWTEAGMRQTCWSVRQTTNIAISHSYTVPQAAQLVGIRIGLSGTSASTMTATHVSTFGTSFSLTRIIDAQAMSTNAYALWPAYGQTIYMNAGDQITFTSYNAEGRTWGIECIFKKIE